MSFNIEIRKAQREDVASIIKIYASDFLGSQRENYTEPLPEGYYQAFETINADKNNYLMVATHENQVIGSIQLIFITHLNHQGHKRGLVESVHIGACLKIFRCKRRSIKI